MIIWAQDGASFVNSKRIDVFSIEENEDASFELCADNYSLGNYNDYKQAEKELGNIANSIIAGEKSHRVC